MSLRVSFINDGEKFCTLKEGELQFYEVKDGEVVQVEERPSQGLWVLDEHQEDR